MIGAFALLLTGCSSEQDDMTGTGQPAEIRFEAMGDGFVQTRSEAIGSSETGPKFGTFHLLQTIDGATDDTKVWGRYQVTSGESGKLSPLSEDDKLFWADRSTQYFFRGISVPPNEDGAEGSVVFDPDTEKGTVRFGNYTGGLEYFVGVTVGPVSLLTHSQTLSVNFQRQVSKLIFFKFTHIDANGEKSNPDWCKITFPNLPNTATFDMEHFRPKQGTFPGFLKQGNDYVTLLPDPDDMGASMEWNYDVSVKEPEALIRYAFYLPPFKFWDGGSNRPEDQPGFFIVELRNGNTYTGNLYGGDAVTEISAGEYIRLLDITLQDGPAAGGGDGSAIAPWDQIPPAEHPHHRLPGIYSQEDADKLLDALLNNKEIPATFYQEDETTGGKKIIRLFKNMDWSSVTKEITIPDGYVLEGQGFLIKLGTEGSINPKNLKGELYINGKLHIDGVPQEE